MSYISPEQIVAAFERSASRFPSQSFQVFNPNMNEEQMRESVNSMQSYAQELYKKYHKYVCDMPDNWTKRAVVMNMEAWDRATRYMDEATKGTAITPFNKNMMGLIRAVLPSTATEKAFTLQPMLGPVSTIFAITPTYGTSTKNVTAGSPLFNNLDPTYGEAEIEDEALATGDGSSTTIGTSTLGSAPIVPGTLKISDGDQFIMDDGAGNIIGNGTGTINYTSGALVITWGVAPDAGAVIGASYTVDNETNADAIPDIDLTLTQMPITARRKAIKFRYSLIAEFALRDQYGIEAQSELTQAVAAEIAYGIDILNFKKVVSVAIDKRNDSYFTFNADYSNFGGGFPLKDFYQTFINSMIKCSSQIVKQSGRVAGNGIVAGEQVTNMLETIGLPRFKASQVPVARGIQMIGTLDDRWIILRTVNPEYIGLKFNEYMMFSKQNEMLYAGFVWAPWIAAFETPLTILDDFQARKGMASLYGQKVVNAQYFLKASVKNLTS